MIPAKFAQPLFALILSCMMSFLVTCIATWKTIGFVDGFVGAWMGSWLSSWLFGFFAVLVLAPLTRTFVGRLTKAPAL